MCAAHSRELSYNIPCLEEVSLVLQRVFDVHEVPWQQAAFDTRTVSGVTDRGLHGVLF